MTVRACTESDLDKLLAYRAQVHVDWCRERFARDDVVILVAADGDRILGKLHVEFGNNAEGTPEIVAAVVDPEARGRGIGTQLMGAAEALTRERGHRVLTVGVEDTNPRARRLYERLGYEAFRDGEFPYLGAPEPNPGVWLRKELA